jgi:hypothetical protein
MLRAVIVLTLFLLAFGLSGQAIYESSAYQQCGAEAGGQNSAEHKWQEKVVSFVSRSRIVFHCAERSIADNNPVVSAIATVVIAVFTTILGLFTMSLAKSTRIAANAAKESADAAKDSAGVARQSLVTVQRAFVFIDSFQGDVLIDQLIVMPKWRNSGTTPTRYMTNWVSWKPFTSEPPDEFNFPDLGEGGDPVDEKDKKPTLAFIGPNATVFAQTITIPKPVLDEMRAGHVRLFVWGWTKYQDVFGADRMTKFCNEIKILASWQQGEKVASAISFPNYRRHNCTDEECERQETK